MFYLFFLSFNITLVATVRLCYGFMCNLLEPHVFDAKSSMRFIYVNLEMTGRGSAIGSVCTWHASGPTFGPYFRGDLVMKNNSTAILPLPLNQEEQLSVGERLDTNY